MGLALTMSCGVDRRSRDEEIYTVASTYLPERIDPHGNMINVYHYLNLQLFYPLFTAAPGQTLMRSMFLDMNRTHALDRTFTRFSLCLREGLTFGNNQVVDVLDLYDSLQRLHTDNVLLGPFSGRIVDDRCLRVELSRSDELYFNKLTTVSSTILARGSGGQRIPVGLGPYRITRWAPDHIDLDYQGSAPDVRFRKVRMQKVQSMDEAKRLGIIDLNLLYWEPFRSKELSGRFSISHPILRSHIVVVSHPDETLRKSFTYCFPRQDFLAALTSLELQPLPGYLPYGTLGSAVSFADVRPSLYGDACSFAGPKPTLVYLNHLPQAHEQIVSFFERYADNLPFRVEVKHCVLSDVIRSFLQHETVLYLVGADSPTSQAAQLGEPLQFLERFYTPSRFICDPLLEIKPWVQAAALTRNVQEKTHLYEEAHRRLLASGYIVPLGQIAPKLYYPASLRSFEFADPIIGYPNIETVQ